MATDILFNISKEFEETGDIKGNSRAELKNIFNNIKEQRDKLHITETKKRTLDLYLNNISKKAINNEKEAIIKLRSNIKETNDEQINDLFNSVQLFVKEHTLIQASLDDISSINPSVFKIEKRQILQKEQVVQKEIKKVEEKDEKQEELEKQLEKQLKNLTPSQKKVKIETNLILLFKQDSVNNSEGFQKLILDDLNKNLNIANKMKDSIKFNLVKQLVIAIDDTSKKEFALWNVTKEKEKEGKITQFKKLLIKIYGNFTIFREKTQVIDFTKEVTLYSAIVTTEYLTTEEKSLSGEKEKQYKFGFSFFQDNEEMSKFNNFLSINKEKITNNTNNFTDFVFSIGGDIYDQNDIKKTIIDNEKNRSAIILMITPIIKNQKNNVYLSVIQNTFNSILELGEENDKNRLLFIFLNLFIWNNAGLSSKQQDLNLYEILDRNISLYGNYKEITKDTNFSTFSDMLTETFGNNWKSTLGKNVNQRNFNLFPTPQKLFPNQRRTLISVFDSLPSERWKWFYASLFSFIGFVISIFLQDISPESDFEKEQTINTSPFKIKLEQKEIKKALEKKKK